MDDSQTRDTLDSLADLFLTQPPPARVTGAGQSDQPGDSGEPASRDAQAQTNAPDPAHTTGEGTPEADRSAEPEPATAVPTGDDPLTGPEPIRLSPSPRPAGPAAGLADQANRPTDPQRGTGPGQPRGSGSFSQATTPPSDWPEPEGPSLRLHREDPEPAGRNRTGRGQPRPPLTGEGVILGNLPGVGGPWLAQYAQQAIAPGQAAAVLHTGEPVELELVAQAESSPPGRSTAASTGQAASTDLIGMLDALAEHESGGLARVLLHPTEDEPAALAGWLAAMPGWTLITGTDAAAQAAAAQQVRQLLDEAPSLADRPLGLYLAGVDQASGEPAGRSLVQAIEPMMRAPVRITGMQQQIKPVHVRQLGRFSDDAGQHHRLHDWLANRAAGGRPSSPAGDETRGRSGGETRRQAQGSASRPGPVEAAAFGPEPAGPAEDTSGERGDESSPSAGEAPDLAQLLAAGRNGVTGGVALEARCPHQPGTQLLLDQAGRLHLLRRHEPASGQSNEREASELDQLRAAIADLLEARQWVNQHIDLLQLTQRQCRFDTDRPPVLHLFTHRADLAAGLAHRLGDQLQLHLLERVQLNRETGWYCTPLN